MNSANGNLTASFDDVRRAVYSLLTEAQDLLLDSPNDRAVFQARAVRDALSYLAATKQALIKAAPLVTDYAATDSAAA